jgi:hypothetical protein
MAKTPTIKTLTEEVGISRSYASMILSQERTPPKSLAIAIFRKTGWRHPAIRKMATDDMAVFEKHEPWIAPSARPTAKTGSVAA